MQLVHNRFQPSALHFFQPSQRSRYGTLLALLLAAAVNAQAGDISVTVADPGGNPVSDAVLSLLGDKPAKDTAGAQAIMDQHSKQFDPHVLAVRTRTSVSFPNSDDIHHEVYSFSKTHPFELPLYHGAPAAPVVFNTPGLVVLGCNIHDNMLGYIYVVDSPWFAKTDAAGKASITAVPPGKYRARLWYPGLTEAAALLEQNIEVPTSGPVVIAFKNAQRETRTVSPTTTRSWNDRRTTN